VRKRELEQNLKEEIVLMSTQLRCRHCGMSIPLEKDMNSSQSRFAHEQACAYNPRNEAKRAMLRNPYGIFSRGDPEPGPGIQRAPHPAGVLCLSCSLAASRPIPFTNACGEHARIEASKWYALSDLYN